MQICSVKGIFLISSGNYEYQNLTTGSLLKVNCNVKSETLLKTICTIKLKSIGSILHFKWIFYLCMIL